MHFMIEDHLVPLHCQTPSRLYDIEHSNIASIYHPLTPDFIVFVESEAYYCCNALESIGIPKSVCGLVKKHLRIAFI